MDLVIIHNISTEFEHCNTTTTADKLKKGSEVKFGVKESLVNGSGKKG